MLKVNLEGTGPIDNSVIFLEDPREKMSHFLKPASNDGKKWESDEISVPISGELDYSLYVQAFSGTQFECTITNLVNDKTITFSGVTGRTIKNHANVVGSDNI